MVRNVSDDLVVKAIHRFMTGKMPELKHLFEQKDHKAANSQKNMTINSQDEFLPRDPPSSTSPNEDLSVV